MICSDYKRIFLGVREVTMRVRPCKLSRLGVAFLKVQLFKKATFQAQTVIVFSHMLAAVAQGLSTE